MTSSSIIEIYDVCFQYPGGHRVLDNLSLRIGRQEFIVLAGRNGSGKSTLLRHLNGLLIPNSGNVLVDQKSTKKDLINARKTVGMVFQDADAQMVGDTVFDEIAFGLENLKQSRDSINRKVHQVLEQLGISSLKDRNPWTLSGGEKRKVAIAGVLVMNPKVIAFDEPFSNLDYPGALQVLETIIELHCAGHTIIIATHDIETVICHADRLIVVADGKIQLDGSPESLLDRLESFGIRQPCSSKFGLGLKPWQ